MAPSREESRIPRFLAHASECLAETLDYESTLLTVAGMALPYLGSWCIVDVTQADGSMARLGIVHPDPLKQECARRLKEGWPPDRNHPIGLPRVIETRATEVIPSVPDELLVAVASGEGNLQDLRDLGIGSVVVVPLIARGNVIGAITFVSSDTGRGYSDADVELAEDLAARCSIALDNARLFRDLDGIRKGMSQLNEKLVISAIREQEMAEEAQDANDAKSRFLAAMSHEIRTPLNAIVGYTDLLDMELGGPVTPKQREYIARVKASSVHLIGLIGDVLDLAKLEAGRVVLDQQPVSARTSILEAIALLVPQARSAGVNLKTDCHDLLCSFTGDEGRVRQILVILMSNALKFTDAGGQITVSCGTSQTPDTEATLTGDGPWTWIRVADTGIGISPAEAKTVFQPFAQVDPANTRKQGGAGLGLSIGLELARRMGGDLSLRSAPGEGSTFTLWMPAGAPMGGGDG